MSEPRRRAGGASQGRAARLDATGAALVVAWVLWLALSPGGTAVPTAAIALILASTASYLIGRIVARHAGWFVPAAIVALATVVALVARAELYGRSPLAEPLGYANANAALYTQAAIAGLMVAAGVRRFTGRAAGGVAACAFALVPLLNGSRAGVLILVVLTPLTLLLQHRVGGIRAAALSCGVIGLLVLSATLVLGATHRGENDRLAAPAGKVLSERRLDLWKDALTLAADHPLRGAGPGAFARESRTAQSDSDARWAHNEYLQHAAEAGLPALVLMVAVFLWGLARIEVAAVRDQERALALAGWTALAVHASVDYVLHFGTIPIVTAALAGSSSAGPHPLDALD